MARMALAALPPPPPPPPLLLLLLLLAGPGPSPVARVDAAIAGPWDGIVGFLQTVAHIQDRRPDPESVEAEDDNGGPVRKIVYAVEEQVSGDDVKTNGSVVIYDSQRDAGLDQTQTSALGREKRSSESAATSADEESGRQNGNVLPRPYLIGRKLWYVPLWFSLYLILYILALTVKSVARHKIKYPTLVSEDALLKRRNGYANAGITRRVTNAISNGEQRYQQQWSM